MASAGSEITEYIILKSTDIVDKKWDSGVDVLEYVIDTINKKCELYGLKLIGEYTYVTSKNEKNENIMTFKDENKPVDVFDIYKNRHIIIIHIGLSSTVRLFENMSILIISKQLPKAEQWSVGIYPLISEKASKNNDIDDMVIDGKQYYGIYYTRPDNYIERKLAEWLETIMGKPPVKKIEDAKQAEAIRAQAQARAEALAQEEAKQAKAKEEAEAEAIRAQAQARAEALAQEEAKQAKAKEEAEAEAKRAHAEAEAKHAKAKEEAEAEAKRVKEEAEAKAKRVKEEAEAVRDEAQKQVQQNQNNNPYIKPAFITLGSIAGIIIIYGIYAYIQKRKHKINKDKQNKN